MQLRKQVSGILPSISGLESDMNKGALASDPVANPAATISGPTYRFTVLSDVVIRYEWAADGVFEDRASTTVINRKFTPPSFHTKNTANRLEIETPALRLTYDKKRFSSNGLSVVLKFKLNLWGSEWKYGSTDDSNLGGTARTLDCADGRCDMGMGILSRAGYSALDDSQSMLFDGEGFVAPRRPGDRIDGYFFCYGLDFKGAMRAFYAISGHQPTLPRWSLGNWWSRYYKYTAEEYIKLMNEFTRRRIPLSVAVIDMDWHMVEDERVPHTGWTGYTWDKKLFPDPSAFGKALHDMGLKITLNDHPHAGIHHHEDAYQDMAKALDRSTTDKAPIEFDPTDPRFMKAYLDILHRNLERQGCDFWWIDWQQGSESRIPGVDPLWLLNHFHFLDSAQQSERGMIFSRYAGPGSHRYPVGFSGDTIATWASLAFQPEFTATASNVGFGWWSHDLGGHMDGYRDDEMVARWIQYGVFSPILRLHSSNSRWTSKEPWLYRSESQETIEKFMKFRHRLVPYLYTMNVFSATNDEPLVQPMYWSHPARDEAYNVPTQYSFGTELIVAPIVEPRKKITNLASVSVWVPPGRHVDMFTGTVYDGDRQLIMYRPLNALPVLLREGGILPLDSSQTPLNGCANPTAYVVHVVVGADADFTLFEDPRDDAREAQTPTTQDSEFRKAHFQWVQASGQLQATVHGGDWTFLFLSTVYGEKTKVRVSFADGQAVDSASHANQVGNNVRVEIGSLPEGTNQIWIDLGEDAQLSHPNQSQQVEDLLRNFQIGFAIKDKIWQILTKDQEAHIKATSIAALGLEEDVVGPLMELMCAGAGKNAIRADRMLTG